MALLGFGVLFSKCIKTLNLPGASLCLQALFCGMFTSLVWSYIQYVHQEAWCLTWFLFPQTTDCLAHSTGALFKIVCMCVCVWERLGRGGSCEKVTSMHTPCYSDSSPIIRIQTQLIIVICWYFVTWQNKGDSNVPKFIIVVLRGGTDPQVLLQAVGWTLFVVCHNVE